ncbi:MAG: sigma-70 family RNA polymerase sigma factor [Ignavibacteriaceae bacterium]|nr:sigma-70 family RNA polymerase sigma factor [bacterium BMS3Abin03]
MEDYKSFTDSQLMQKVSEYDSKSLEELYDRYSPILYTLIKKIVADQKIAEEVLTDIFVIVWEKSRKIDLPINNVYTWLITLARNKAIDRKRRDESTEELPEYNDDYENDYVIPRLSKFIDPLDLNNALSVKENFEGALNDLTDAQQYVLYLAYYEGKTENEIAKKLNIPLPTVKSKIKVALTSLKHNLITGA